MKLVQASAITLALFSGAHFIAGASADRTEQYPNPYRLVENPLTLPQGRQWGFVLGIDVDRSGNVWVLDTCGGDLQECTTSKVDPVQKFEASGRFLKSFGGGMIVHPHGLYIDPSGSIWILDGFGGTEKQPTKGQQVFKFTPDGKLLLTLGTAGVKGATEKTFNMPSDVLVAPNGDIFVADGHADDSNARIVKFTKDGTFIKAWGTEGKGPGQFSETHSLAMDSRGRLFVGDRRNNHRIQIFDQNGKFLEEWKQFGSPAELFIDRHDVLYVADALSGLGNMNPGKKPGIYIGSAKDGRVTTFIPDIEPNRMQELVVADAAGHLWTGCTVGRCVRKWVKK